MMFITPQVGAVEADVGAGVADVGDHVTDDLLQVNPGGGGHFASDDRYTGFHQSLARHTGELVFGDDGVQHRIRNLVGDFCPDALQTRTRR